MRLWTGAVFFPILLLAVLAADQARAEELPGVVVEEGPPPPLLQEGVASPLLPGPGPFVPPVRIDPKNSRYVLINPEAPRPWLGRRLLNHVNLKCWTSFKEPTCQTCWSDLKFILGSCKC